MIEKINDNYGHIPEANVKQMIKSSYNNQEPEFHRIIAYLSGVNNPSSHQVLVLSSSNITHTLSCHWQDPDCSDFFQVLYAQAANPLSHA